MKELKEIFSRASENGAKNEGKLLEKRIQDKNNKAIESKNSEKNLDE